MNSCVLMASIVTEPELRNTQDGLEVANMSIEIPGLRENDPSPTIRAVGWGNLGSDICSRYKIGDRVIIEGRLSMNIIEKDGYKEKRAEIVISRIFPNGASTQQSMGSNVSSIANGGSSSNVFSIEEKQIQQQTIVEEQPVSSSSETVKSGEDYKEKNYDNIPF